MSFESEAFKRSKTDIKKLLEFGFTPSNGRYCYSRVLLSGEFRAEITADESGVFTGVVIDLNTGEEYDAFRNPHRTGEFVGRVREEYSSLLSEIRQSCCTEMPFIFDQSNRIAKMVLEEYGEKPDYPFSTAPTYGVFRNSSNKKWYGLVMNVSRNKVTKKPSDKTVMVEILNLKSVPEKIPELLLHDGIYKCYHMNKESWLSVLLDDTETDETVMELLRESKRLTDRKGNRGTGFIVPSNPKHYDIETEFAKGTSQVWKQGKGIKKGDIVYIYVGAPVSAIRYKCIVTQTDIPYDYKEGSLTIKSLMKIEILEYIDRKKCPLSKMKEFGVTTVRGVRYMPKELEDYLKE